MVIDQLPTAAVDSVIDKLLYFRAVTAADRGLALHVLLHNHSTSGDFHIDPLTVEFLTLLDAETSMHLLNDELSSRVFTASDLECWLIAAAAGRYGLERGAPPAASAR